MRTLWHWLRKILVVFWKDISSGAQISWTHLKAIWWLKYLLLTIVAIVALAVWAQDARIAEDPNRFAKWLYKFLDDWAITLGAAVTFMLAVAAFLAILDNRQGRRADRKERLLNEIIEWAVGISKCGIEKGYPDISNLIDLHAVWLKISNNIGDIILCFKEMRGKNQYISEIVKALDQDLREASKTLTDDFEEHIRLLSLCETYMRDREKSWEKAVGHKHKLKFSAKKVIEEATKIKTRDIG